MVSDVLKQEVDTMSEEEVVHMGRRLIDAGIISENQRDIVLDEQHAWNEQGKHIRFGELAVEMGFCTTEQVEALPGYMGDRLVEEGLITLEQKQLLISWQKRLRDKGIFVKFGELMVSEGFCSQSEIEAVITISQPEQKIIQ